MESGILEERQNPFKEKEYGTPHNTAPFDRIRLQDYEPAFEEGMREDKELTDRIASNPEPPTFDNTIAYEVPDSLLDRVSTVFFNLLSVETNDDMDALAQKISPVLTEHANDILLNEKLFARIKAVHESHRPLSGEEQMLLDNTYSSFVRNGAGLSADEKEEFRKLTKELSALTLKFQQNMLKETNNFELVLNEKGDLAGLPDSAVEAAALTAKEKGKEGCWVFTLHAPSYGPFMTYADNRALRRRMYLAKNTICTHQNEWNNFEIVKRIVNLRLQCARLLGYHTYADFVLERRMAENSGKVYDLLRKLLKAYMPTAKREVEAVEDKAREMEGEDFVLQAWDFAYYSHKLELEKFNIDAEMLRPYFELSRVKQGVFGLATRLYGITFKENADIPVYHPEVKAYDVFDGDGSFLAVLYTDFHPRESKQSGAWMTSYKDQWIDEKGNHRPHVSVVMNLTKPTESKPALLTLGEVETFLHEFGHALHGIFANTRFESLSGTNVYWDFVELPSQIMENFAVEREFLNTFARHYETGEPLPEELMERIVKSRNFNVAYACIRQVSYGLLDMAYYTLDKDLEGDVREFERRAWRDTQLLPEVEESCMSVQFGHIMSGGYAAGYYSYKWAEVLEADAFSLFKEKGIFNRETAQSFRDNILSRGGTEPPMTLYKRFRGKEPTIDALLKRNGIGAQ